MDKDWVPFVLFILQALLGVLGWALSSMLREAKEEIKANREAIQALNNKMLEDFMTKKEAQGMRDRVHSASNSVLVMSEKIHALEEKFR